MRSYLDTPPCGGESRMSKAVIDVIDERRRQVQQEGWDESHDDQHLTGEMATAAACYAMSPEERDGRLEVGTTVLENYWSWDWSWWKPTDRRRDLVKAGALVLAEIERLDRAEARKTEPVSLALLDDMDHEYRLQQETDK